MAVQQIQELLIQALIPRESGEPLLPEGEEICRLYRRTAFQYR